MRFGFEFQGQTVDFMEAQRIRCATSFFRKTQQVHDLQAFYHFLGF